MKKVFLILSIVALVVTVSTSFIYPMSVGRLISHLFSNKTAGAAAPADAAAPARTLHDFTMKSIDGKPVSLGEFKGKKVIVLNTASECGYTPQYDDWETFYENYGTRIVVLGFPANNFGGQEPGSNEQIAAFCKKNFGVSFPMFEKIDVVGESQHPLYQWLSKKSLNGWNDKAPGWNFCKYVIDENGKLTHFFASGVKPTDPEFQKAVGI